MRRIFVVFLSVLVILFVGDSNAYAYLDPGSAGLLYQVGYMVVGVVIAWFAGIGHLMKAAVLRLRGKSLDKADEK